MLRTKLQPLRILPLFGVLGWICAANAWAADLEQPDQVQKSVPAAKPVFTTTGMLLTDNSSQEADSRKSHNATNDSAGDESVCCCDCNPLYVNVYGGYDYASGPIGKSYVAGMGGAAMTYRPDIWGVTGSYTGDLESADSQGLGTVGVFKLPDYSRCRLVDRMTCSLLYDIYSDFGSTSTFSQLRVRGGYAAPVGVELGVIYTQPLSESVGDPAKLLANQGIGDVQLRQAVQGYLSSHVLLMHTLPVYAVLRAGWREKPYSEILGANFEVPLSGRASVFTGFDYEDREGVWAHYTGVNFRF
jgi:hypothetical protein